MSPLEWNSDNTGYPLDKLTPAQLQRLWNDIWFGVEASKPAPTRSALSMTEGDLGFFDLDAIRVVEEC